MVVVNVHLSGDLETFVNGYINRGRAATKAEVIRQGILMLMSRQYEDISDDPEMEKMLLEEKSGKRKFKFLGKVSNAKDFLK